MQVEVTAAVNLIAGHLYNKLPRRRVDAFADEIEKGIVGKFQGHWYPDNPNKGAAYRCINVSGENVDQLFLYAAINSGLDIEEVTNYLPKDLRIWIDPGEVSFCSGEKGPARVLYSERRANNAGGCISPTEDSVPITSMHQPLSFTSCTTAAAPVPTAMPVVTSPLASPDELTSNLSSSLGSLSLSSGGSGNNCNSSSWGTTPSPVPWATTSNNNNPWSPMSPQKPAFFPWSTETNYNAMNVQPAFHVGVGASVGVGGNAVPRPTNNNNKTMTAAMFAQTKFGSTKLKNHSKRSNRLSPTESFSRALHGTNSYHNGTMRQNPTMTTAFLDRMQMHMNNNQQEFPIDQFKMNGNAMRTSTDRFAMATGTNNNTIGSSNGSIGRYSPCPMNSTLAGMFSGDQDWIDLSDMAMPSSGNQLLAA